MGFMVAIAAFRVEIVLVLFDFWYQVLGTRFNGLLTTILRIEELLEFFLTKILTAIYNEQND